MSEGAKPCCLTESLWRESWCDSIKVSQVQMLRAFVKQRLTAAAGETFEVFERTIAEYEEELESSSEEIHRQQKLLDAVFKPEVPLHRADVLQLLVVQDLVPQSGTGGARVPTQYRGTGRTLDQSGGRAASRSGGCEQGRGR